MPGTGLLHETLTSQIIGAAIDVHRALGAGYQENVYANALSVALAGRGVSHAREHEVDLYFEGTHIGKHRLDLLVEDTVIVELKAVEKVLEVHKSQTRSYLKSTGKQVALLLNFEAPVLEVKRFVLTDTHM
jgi:GxxExxY protein